MANILVIDDEREITLLLTQFFRLDGHTVSAVIDPEEGLQLMKQERFDIVVTDLCMPGIDGLEVLQRCKLIDPSTEVVLITAHATVETAREALKRGAVDYLTKPFSLEKELGPLINQILANSAAEDAAVRSDELDSLPGNWDRMVHADDEIVAVSPSMLDVLGRARRVAHSEANVLVRGQSGTGKEILARLIHRHSARRDRPLVTVNCAALPDTLLESELFGHTRGAFTGAISDRMGFFEAADGGTIFLDEIGEISPNFQLKLLRVLESGEFHRIGDAKKIIEVDVRVIAATNRDLENAMQTGRFREDLYYRLNVISLAIPSLRDRLEDIPALLDRFVQIRDKNRYFSSEARELLLAYDWPGNVRELINAVEHAIVLCENHRMDIEHLPMAIQDLQLTLDPSHEQEAKSAGTLEDIEVRCIIQAMVKMEYNQTRAAHLLGISRRTLGYRIEKYGLTDELRPGRTSSDEPSKRKLKRMRTDRPAPSFKNSSKRA